MNTIRYFDMFAGVGGFRTGLTNTGGFFMPAGWCEIDKYAQKAYRTLYETDSEYFGTNLFVRVTARAIKPDEVPDFDLLCAGFRYLTCQIQTAHSPSAEEDLASLIREALSFTKSCDFRLRKSGARSPATSLSSA